MGGFGTAEVLHFQPIVPPPQQQKEMTISVKKQVQMDKMVQELGKSVKVTHLSEGVLEICRYGYFERPDLGVGGMYSLAPRGRIVVDNEYIVYKVNVIPHVVISILLMFIALAVLSDYWVLSAAMVAVCILLWLSTWVNHRLLIHLAIRKSQIQP